MTEMNLEPKEILKLEFEYAQETAEQAQDDRTAIMNLYLLLVGGVGSIVVGLSQSGAGAANLPRNAAALLFALLAITGFFVLMKLVRLRQAWFDSARAMNRIKEFYLERFPELDKAFLWKPGTIPSRNKPWTITFNLCLLVAILDSVALGIAVNYGGLRSTIDYLPEVFAATMYFLWQLWFYFFQLRAPDEENGRGASAASHGDDPAQT
jgi:amino acid permease